MKRLIAALLAALLALGLGACKSRVPPGEETPPERLEESLPQEDEEEPLDLPGDEEEREPEESQEDPGEAEAAARDFMTALQSGSADRIREYTDYKNLLQLEAGDSEQDMLAILGRVQFELREGSQVSGKTAFVPVTIRNVNMHTVLPDFLKRAMDLEYNNNILDDPKTPEEMEGEYQKLFAQLLDSHGTDLLERNLELNLVRSGSGWRVQVTSELRSALFGDYWEASRKAGPNAGGGQS